ncbi:alginate export family protein [Collimonas sp. NPDC087041]|uniref:alginate export family protein n=1 Tax=Collimonas sp. NPDC087041 TaxID=3363960 RepID=UPI003818F4D2
MRRSDLPSVLKSGGFGRRSLLALIAGCVPLHDALAQDVGVCGLQRPAISFNRWQEDWGVLADLCLPRKPFDQLKYIALSDDGISYLSLGAGLRERMEVNNSALFGTGGGRPNTYFLQRAQLHGDLRLGEHVQAFLQLEDARPFRKDAISPVDKDQLDVEQAFVTATGQLDSGTFKVRAGRQEMAFDLQRFVSVRDGPNVRQAFDALWGDWESGQWRTIGYVTHPVQNRSATDFDDTSNSHLTFNGVRLERKNVGPGDLSAYYSRYSRDGAKFLDASGDERRDVVDMRYAINTGRIDWDVEIMGQGGRVGNKTISAWALGSLGGYTFTDQAWKPRLGMQLDVASGDRHPGDGQIGTFNPLFPNGYYFTLAGFTGYSNLIHVKPSLTIRPSATLTVLTALGLQWRATTADAVYAQGSTAAPGTAGRGDRWTGAYAQLRTDWSISPNLVTSVEAVHFQVGDTIRQAGGRNGDYLGVELKFGW